MPHHSKKLPDPPDHDGTHDGNIYVIMYCRGTNWNEPKSMQEQIGFSDHIDFLYSIQEKIIAAGPYEYEAPDSRTGLMVLSEENMGAVKVIMEKDPFVLSGILKYEIKKWKVKRIRGIVVDG